MKLPALILYLLLSLFVGDRVQNALSVAYAQLFDFANYDYVPLSGIVELRGPRADTLIRKLRGIN